MNLLVFDLDGTLTRTGDVDARCFAESLIELLPPGAMDTALNVDWASYEHTTDPGIVEEIWERVRGRSPHDEEIRRHHSRFLELLRAAAAKTPEQFGVIEGAQTLLDHLARADAASRTPRLVCVHRHRKLGRERADQDRSGRVADP